MGVSNPKPVTEFTPRNKRYLETAIERKQGEYKESVKKWERDHPGKPDGYSFKRNTIKAWSQILWPNDRFRTKFDDVCWCGETPSPRCKVHG